LLNGLAERSSGRDSGAKALLENVCLILAVEADLKSNVASGIENRVERGRLDFAVIKPGSNVVHGLAEGRPSWLFFHTHDEWGIERHIARAL
jgi:hypothetical protein